MGAYRDCLFRRAIERAGPLRLGAELPDYVGDVLRLIHFGVAEVDHPAEILAHLSDDARKSGERLRRRIPVLGVDPGKIAVLNRGRVLIEPALREDDLQGIGACWQELRQ